MPLKDIPTARERRKRTHDQIVEDSLTIAREMMQADGVAALSFNAIAARLGIKPPSLYTYFPSKHAIYDELFRRGFEAFGQSMSDASDPAQEDPVPGTADSLRRVMEAYMAFALENPDLFQLMFQRPVPGFIPSERSMAVSLSALQQGREALRQLIERGEIQPPYPVDRASDLIIATMYGLTELQLANNPDQPVGAGRFGSLIPEAVQLFLQAWQSPKEET